MAGSHTVSTPPSGWRSSNWTSAAVDAEVAWLHAYEMYGRYRRVLAGAAVAVGTAMLLTLRGTGAGS
ncbi:hypothetical protein GCM10009557_88190 [Virgisporangium ochraceum]